MSFSLKGIFASAKKVNDTGVSFSVILVIGGVNILG